MKDQLWVVEVKRDGEDVWEIDSPDVFVHPAAFMNPNEAQRLLDAHNAIYHDSPVKHRLVKYRRDPADVGDGGE